MVIENEIRESIEKVILKYNNRQIDNSVLNEVLDELEKDLIKENIWYHFIDYLRNKWYLTIRQMIELLVLAYEFRITDEHEAGIMYDKDEETEDVTVVLKGKVFGIGVYAWYDIDKNSIVISSLGTSEYRVSNECLFALKIFIDKLNQKTNNYESNE